MAKAYAFRIALQKAEIKAHGGVQYVEVVYGGYDTRYHSEVFTGTLAEAIARRDELSAAEARCHQASIAMATPFDRKPPGLKGLGFPAHPSKAVLP